MRARYLLLSTPLTLHVGIPSSCTRDPAVSSLEGRRQRGAAASETLRNNFVDLISLVQFDTVAHILLKHKILNPQEIETFRAAATTRALQVEKLLFNVMGKVTARPEWFDVFCNALEAGSTPEMANELRGVLIQYRITCSVLPNYCKPAVL